jgi:hypothetical protein
MSWNARPAHDGSRERRRRLLLIGLIVLAVLVLGGGYLLGTADGDDDTASPSTAPAPTETPSEGPSSSPSSTASRSASTSSSTSTREPEVLTDGRYFVRLADAQEGSLQYDLAYFLTGDEANEAAAERGLETPVPNDYLIVNDFTRLRLTPLAGDVGVKYIPEGNCCDLVKAHESQFLGWMEGSVQTDFPPKESSWWWITIDGGEVTRIEQQYLP